LTAIDAQHRHAGFRREHAGQMRRPARARDDALQAALPGTLGVGKHGVRHPVRGEDLRFERHAERLELGASVAHHVPIALAAHHDTNDRLG
jgi:hypothetical protein